MRKKPSPPPIPPLSLKALVRVQDIQDAARTAISRCSNSVRGWVNPEEASRVLRTCLVALLDAQLAYYSSLPNYHPQWIRQLENDTIESLLGVFPLFTSGEQFRPELHRTAKDHLAERAKPVNAVPMVTEPQDVARRRKKIIEPLLVDRGWSILDWANHANVAYHTAADYLSGSKRPYRSTRVKLAKALGLSPNQLPE